MSAPVIPRPRTCGPGAKRAERRAVYDCVITTKEGLGIHALKRYSAFAQLYARLRATLPVRPPFSCAPRTLLEKRRSYAPQASQQSYIPSLPPKAPLAKFRPAFLDRRRRLLQHWLSAILLHPEMGGCQAVREWVMDRT